MALISENEEKRTRALLKSVSRSFYLSLRFLPRPVRGPLSLAYLLARATDTFADSGSLSTEDRVAALQAIPLTLMGDAPSRAVVSRCCDAALAPAARTELSDGEITLLTRLDELFDWYAITPEDERMLIDDVLGTIIKGQSDDIVRTRIHDEAELERYTYQVAGCVGEFWTKLCALKLPGYARGSMNALLHDGRCFGQGLQLINILRDVPKDTRIGRSYLPNVSPDDTAESKWYAAQPWIDRCRENLQHGRAYTAGIKGVRCRFVVWLPLLLAESTLELVVNAGSVAMSNPVKVPRSRIKGFLFRAWRYALWPRSRESRVF